MKRFNPYVVLFVIGVIVILGVMTIVARTAAKPSGAFQNAATALAFISAAAVGIERIIEGWWSAVDLINPQWPDVGAQSKQLKDANQKLQSAVKNIQNALDQLLTGSIEVKAKLAEAPQAIQALRRTLEQLNVASATDSKLPGLVADAQKAIGAVQAFDPALQTAAAEAPGVLSNLSAFVETFKENPIRRFISLFLGALLGLGLARVFSLDLIEAAVQAPGNTPIPWTSHGFLPHPDIALTGLIIGLGSNPTHEVVKAIQDFKQSQ